MKTFVNMLPWSFRRDRLLRRRLRQWLVAWALVAAVLAGGAWIDWAACRTVREALEQKERSYEEVKQIRTEMAALRAIQKGLGNQQDLLGRLQAAPPPLLVVGLVSQSAEHCRGRVMVRHLVYQHQGAGPAAARGAPPAALPPVAVQTVLQSVRREAASLTLQGVGADNLAVAEFVVGLREAGVFERVDLKSAAESQSSSNAASVYQVECGF
ncbi:MAG TPA: PilN domain-containing protein [Pirellulales bacterium]|jgi:hypothetical protein|nr:PilN domain-containing protein [Pirellulales bacterium]